MKYTQECESTGYGQPILAPDYIVDIYLKLQM